MVSPADFQYVRRLVRDHSALALDDGKEYLVEARLSPIVQREGLGSVSELVGRLRAGSDRLCEEVADALATNETSFFRDVHPFEALRTEVLPSLLADAGGRPLSLWSAAAATGQEAYSLALVLREHFPGAAATVLATDLAREVLTRAADGCFTQLEVNRGLPAALLVKHFERHGLQWRVKEPVRRMVRFRQLNLAREWPSLPAMDVVFLRNVLIYFDAATKVAVLDRISRVLRRGGWLFLGSAETTYGLDARYERVEVGRSTCYRLTRRDGTER